MSVTCDSVRLNQFSAPIVQGVLCDSWEYVDADTQHLTHNIHRYSGKFIPQIAARAISLLTRPGELVVDPYCGSGTTILEGALLKRRVIGVDLNPLAVLIAQTKVTPVPRAKLDGLVHILRQELLGHMQDDALPLFGSVPKSARAEIEQDSRFHDGWFRKWFQPQVLSELIAIDLAIARVDDERLRNVARVAFSDILRKSSNAHSGYPNVMFDRNAPERKRPIRPFLQALTRVADMVAALENVDGSWAEVSVVHGNAASLPVGEGTVDAIVTHPPYIGSIPYAEYGALSLQWLGVDPKQLDKNLTGGRRQASDVVQRFESGYGQMLNEAARVLKRGGYAFLMVGNPVVRDKVVDLAEMSLDLAREAGLQFVVRSERRGVNRRANKMDTEHLLFFQKT